VPLQEAPIAEGVERHSPSAIAAAAAAPLMDDGYS